MNARSLQLIVQLAETFEQIFYIQASFLLDDSCKILGYTLLYKKVITNWAECIQRNVEKNSKKKRVAWTRFLLLCSA